MTPDNPAERIKVRDGHADGTLGAMLDHSRVTDWEMMGADEILASTFARGGEAARSHGDITTEGLCKTSSQFHEDLHGCCGHICAETQAGERRNALFYESAQTQRSGRDSDRFWSMTEKGSPHLVFAREVAPKGIARSGLTQF